MDSRLPLLSPAEGQCAYPHDQARPFLLTRLRLVPLAQRVSLAPLQKLFSDPHQSPATLFTGLFVNEKALLSQQLYARLSSFTLGLRKKPKGEPLWLL